MNEYFSGADQRFYKKKCIEKGFVQFEIWKIYMYIRAQLFFTTQP
jgi:hypothetical protein